MRKSLGLVVLAMIVALLLPGTVLANENIMKFYERHSDTLITQGEWAVLLVRAMGRDDEMQSSDSQFSYIAILEKYRVKPLDGWNHGEYLHYGAKAVTMVQALGLEEQVPPDAVELHYVWLLESLGFHEGHPAELVKHSDALQRNVNDPIFQEFAGNEFNINISKFAPRTEETN